MTAPMKAIAVALAGVAALALAAGDAAALTVELRHNPPALVGTAVGFEVHAEGHGALTYAFRFGDGETAPPSPSPSATHTYARPGHYPVIVTVRDEQAVRTATFLQTIHVAVTAPAATASTSIVCDGGRRRVFHVNPDQGTVSSVDSEQLRLVWEAPVGPAPRAVALAPDGSLWVTSQDSASIAILDADSGRLLRSLALPYASRPYGLAFASTGDAYVTLQATGELARIRPATGAVARAAVGRLPAGLAIRGDGARALVTRLVSPADHGEVIEVDGASLAVVAVHRLALDPGPDGEFGARGVPNYLAAIAISPDGRRAWIPSKKDNVLRGLVRDGRPLDFESSVRAIVSQLDLATGAEDLPARRDLNDRSLLGAVAFSPLGDYVFVADTGTHHVEILDAYTGDAVGGATAVGLGPSGLALCPDGRLFVHAFLSRSVIAFDARAVLASDDFALPRLSEIRTVATERLAPEVLAGKKIFYDAADPRMTRDGYISCAGCHLDGFEDGQVWDFTDRGEGLRNTTSLLGRRGAAMGRLHWSANFDEIQDFEHDMRNAFGGRGFLPDPVFHTGTRDTTLGEAKAGLSPELDALAAYVASLDRVHPSPYRAPGGALTADAVAGEAIFARLECATCHAGPDFTDSATGALHDVGTIRPTSGHRLGGELTGLDTPTLLGVWETAPYLHDGSAPTLRDVLTTANASQRHGATAALSERELDQLVAYLMQLDQGPPPAPELPPDGGVDAGIPDAAQPAGDDDPAGGCGCAARGGGADAPGLALLVLLVLRLRASGRSGSPPARRRGWCSGSPCSAPGSAPGAGWGRRPTRTPSRCRRCRRCT